MDAKIETKYPYEGYSDYKGGSGIIEYGPLDRSEGSLAKTIVYEGLEFHEVEAIGYYPVCSQGYNCEVRIYRHGNGYYIEADGDLYSFEHITDEWRHEFEKHGEKFIDLLQKMAKYDDVVFMGKEIEPNVGYSVINDLDGVGHDFVKDSDMKFEDTVEMLEEDPWYDDVRKKYTYRMLENMKTGEKYMERNGQITGPWVYDEEEESWEYEG